MATFDWKIESMKNYPAYAGQSDVVFSVNWQCSASQEGATGAISKGTVDVTYVEGEPFTPYAELTEEKVWAWINPSIERSEIEANLQVMINAQLAPTEEMLPLPWPN